jgi:hypothetical protein
MTRPGFGVTAHALVFAGLFAATGSAAPDAAPKPAAVGAAVAPDGTVLAVSCDDGRKVVVRVAPKDGAALDREVVLPGLPADAKVVDARVAPWLWRERRSLALGLVVRREATARFEYRYAVEVDREGGTAWSLSDPIFEDGGKAWRIAEIRQNVADGDTIEILFTRGFNSPRLGGPPAATLEVRQFTDVCAGGGAVGIGGKDRLVSLEAKR